MNKFEKERFISGMIIGAILMGFTCLGIIVINKDYYRGVRDCYTGTVTLALDSLSMEYELKHLK